MAHSSPSFSFPPSLTFSPPAPFTPSTPTPTPTTTSSSSFTDFSSSITSSSSSSSSSSSTSTSTTSSTFSLTSSSSSSSSLPPTPSDSDDPPSSSSSTPTFLASSYTIPTSSSSSSLVVLTLTSSSPSPTATHSSDLSFFSDTAAVAGTFTVVSLVGIALIIAVVLFARRRYSRSYDDDAEFLDKLPELSPDPPLPPVTYHDDGSSDQSHYGAPLALPPPPVAYYPDHAHAFHPHAFSGGFPPIGSIDGYHPHRIYSPEDHVMNSAPRPNIIMPHPDRFAHVQLDSAPRNQVTLAHTLRPSANTTLSVPDQQENRLSVDSFYSGIETEAPPSSGRAI